MRYAMSLDNGGKVQATVTADNILDYITDNNGSNLTDIADELGVAKSTAYRHVNTLVELGFLTKEEQTYLPGFRMFKYASAAQTNFPIFDIATEEIDRVSQISNEQVALYIERNERLYEIYRTGSQDLAPITDGAAEPLFQSAPGRCLIAHSDWDEVVSIPGARSAVDDLDALEDELQRVRREDVAIEREREGGFVRVAVPICLNDSAVASICVTGPLRRLSGKRLTEDVPGLLQNAAKIIEMQLLSA